MTDNIAVDRIYCGDMTSLAHPVASVVRVYIASTFTDMVLEKTELVNHIFPILKTYCKDRYGIEFQMVDMRWGIRDESTDDHMTTSICLEELEHCKRVSVGPSFFFLMGQKYGYRPLPNTVTADQFEHMLQGLESLNMEDGVRLLKKWYIKDLNCIPACYILQPISSILPNFFNSRNPKLQKVDQEKWVDTLNQLYKFILKGSEILKHAEKISEEEFQLLRMSVIEREFLKGIIEARDTKDDCFAFVRFVKINPFCTTILNCAELSTISAFLTWTKQLFTWIHLKMDQLTKMQGSWLSNLGMRNSKKLFTRETPRDSKLTGLGWMG